MGNDMKSIEFDNMSLSERKYERLCTMIFSCIPSSLLMFDRNLRVVIANKNFLEKSRRTENETIGKHVDEIFPSVILQYTRLSQRIRTVFETGAGDRGREMYYRSPGLLTRVYYYNLTPLIDTQGGQIIIINPARQTGRPIIHLPSLISHACLKNCSYSF